MRIALEDAHRTGRCASHWHWKLCIVLEIAIALEDGRCIGTWPLHCKMAVILEDGHWDGKLEVWELLTRWSVRVGSWPGLAVCGRQCMPSHPRACPTTNASKFSIFQFSIVLAMF
jgi:hypothetical protein